MVGLNPAKVDLPPLNVCLLQMLQVEEVKGNGKGFGSRLPAHTETLLRDGSILPTMLKTELDLGSLVEEPNDIRFSPRTRTQDIRYRCS